MKKQEIMANRRKKVNRSRPRDESDIEMSSQGLKTRYKYIKELMEKRWTK